jgi:FG-GAP-like repeat
VSWTNEGGAWVEGGHFDRVGRARQVAAGDIDGDGDLDLFVPDSWAIQADALYVQVSPGVYVDEGAERIGSSSRAGAARMGDLNGDGHLDIVATDWGQAPPRSPGLGQIYINDGLGRFTLSEGALPAELSETGTGPIDLDLLDFDDDGDLDMLLASRVGDSILLSNDGLGRYSQAPLPPQPGPYVYGPDPCDVDGDADLDLWLDNGAARSGEQLLLNEQGVYIDQSEQVSGNPAADDNEVQCVDIDMDGDLDAIVASLSDEERLLINEGGIFTLQAGAFPAQGDATLGLDLADIDGDGRLDAVTAQGETGRDWSEKHYRGSAEQPVDEAGPLARRVLPMGEGVALVAWQDRSTSDLGPRLTRTWAEVAGAEEAPGRFVGGDLFRYELTSAQLAAAARSDQSLRLCAMDEGGNATCAELEAEELGATAPGLSGSFQGGCSQVAGRGLALGPLLLVAYSALARKRPLTCKVSPSRSAS